MARTSTRSTNDPLRSTPWLWLADAPQRHQTTLLIRRPLTLTAPPASALLHVCVNHLYRLYVNGQAIGRGPARSDPRWPYYDTYELAPHLRPGDNHIVVLAHHFNWAPMEARGDTHRAFCLYVGPAGFWAQIQTEHGPLEDGRHWEAQLAPGWDDCGERIGRFLAYRHQVDLSTFTPALIESLAGTNSADWRAMTVQQSPLLGQPAARPTPPLEPVVREPLTASLVKTSDAAIQNVPAVQRGETDPPITVAGGSQGWLTFDFGRPMGGFTDLEFEAQGPAEVDVYMGEARQTRLADRLRMGPGRWRFESLDWRGGREVMLHVRALGGPVAIHGVRLVEMVYPFEPIGDFACSDPTLTTLWRICRQTVWTAVKDHPVDCLGREQALWIADINIHARAMNAAFGDVRPAEKALQQALVAMHDDGVVPVPGPAALGFKRTAKRIPWSEQPLTLAMTLRDLYWRTGKPHLALEALPRLESLYDFYTRYEDSRGLLITCPPGEPEMVVFGGWNPMLKRGVPTALNFEYVLSLEAAAELALVASKPELAARWRSRAARVRSVARQTFWNSQRKLFIDGECDGQLVTAFSATANAWAALGGGVLDEDRGSWAEAIRTDPAIMASVTPFDASILLEAFARLGLDLHARDVLGEYFGSLVRAGQPTLPEMWMAGEAGGVRCGDDSSACHPYGAGPTYLLHELVLGVRPTEPGYRRVEIAPRTLGLRDARGRVPTPQGPVAVEWHRDDTTWRLRVELPAGVEAQVTLPRLGWVREHLQVNGRKVWEADPRAHAIQRTRKNEPQIPRTVACPLAGGAAYELELRTT